MDRVFELLLVDALASAAARSAAAEEPEDRPDNFFPLPPDNDAVWREVFKKCQEEYMVVGVEFTTNDGSQRSVRAAILRLARNLNRSAIFLRATIDGFNTHDQLRRELGGVQYTPSFYILSFLDGHREVRRYEGSMEVRNACESGELGRGFEQCFERRNQLRTAESIAERLSAGLAAAMNRRRQEEEKPKETTEQRRAQDATLWKEQQEKQKEEARKKDEEEKRQNEEARKAAVEERRRKRPEYIAQLLAMDVNKAPPRELLDIMKKLGVNPTGLTERIDLISELKKEVPEFRISRSGCQPTGGGGAAGTPVSSVTPPPSPKVDFSSMDRDVLQSVAGRVRNIDLQKAELHELKSLLSQARLTVKNYPDRNSMVQALRGVLEASQKSRNPSQSFGQVPNNLSSSHNDDAKLRRKVEMAERNVEELEETRCQQAAMIATLQRQLKEKEEKISSLELRSKNPPPPVVPRQFTNQLSQPQSPTGRERMLEQTLKDIRILFASTKDDFNFISLLDQGSEGIVVKAKCDREELTDQNKIYAIKILTNFYQETSTVTKAREVYKTEYEILSQLLPNPNIVQLHSFFYDRMDPNLVKGIDHPDNRTRSISLFMVMDFHALDLEEHIRELFENHGPKNISVLKWIAQLLSALAYLSSCNIVHRDLKLKNILVAKDSSLKVCDFGSAIKLAGMTLDFQRGMNLPGNKAHQSPELRNPKPNRRIDYSRSDVWAAGVLAFEMCGHPNPFVSIDALGYTEKQLPQLMYTRCKGSLQAYPLPSGLTTLVNSLLMFEPKQRPSAQDAAISAEALT